VAISPCLELEILQQPKLDYTEKRAAKLHPKNTPRDRGLLRKPDIPASAQIYPGWPIRPEPKQRSDASLRKKWNSRL